VARLQWGSAGGRGGFITLYFIPWVPFGRGAELGSVGPGRAARGDRVLRGRGSGRPGFQGARGWRLPAAAPAHPLNPVTASTDTTVGMVLPIDLNI